MNNCDNLSRRWIKLQSVNLIKGTLELSYYILGEEGTRYIIGSMSYRSGLFTIRTDLLIAETHDLPKHDENAIRTFLISLFDRTGFSERGMRSIHHNTALVLLHCDFHGDYTRETEETLLSSFQEASDG